MAPSDPSLLNEADGADAAAAWSVLANASPIHAATQRIITGALRRYVAMWLVATRAALGAHPKYVEVANDDLDAAAARCCAGLAAAIVLGFIPTLEAVVPGEVLAASRISQRRNRVPGDGLRPGPGT